MSETPKTQSELPSASTAPRRGGLRTPLLVGGIALAIVAVVFVLAILRGDRGGAPSLGAGGGSSIPERGRAAEGAPSILSPIGTVPRAELTLVWSMVEGLDAYEAAVYDNQAIRIWVSGRIQSDRVPVPPSVLRDLAPGAAYFWQVTGFGAGGREAQSPSVQFALQP